MALFLGLTIYPRLSGRRVGLTQGGDQNTAGQADGRDDGEASGVRQEAEQGCEQYGRGHVSGNHAQDHEDSEGHAVSPPTKVVSDGCQD